MLEPTANPIRELHEHIKDFLLEIDMEKINNALAHDNTPESERAPLTGLLTLLEELSNTRLTNIPSKIFSPIRDRINAALIILKSPGARMKDQSTGKYIKTYIEDIANIYSSLYATTAPVVAFELHRDANTERRNSAAQFELSSIQKTRHECEEIKNKLKEYSVDTVISRQSEHFSREAAEHQKYAQRWLYGVAGFALLVTLIALYASIHPPSALVHDSLPLTIFAYFPRFLALSISFYALSLCARNYRTSRHNYIINKHRSIALSTFDVFATSATESKVKDAILAQAASTIFSPQPSGYSVDQAEPLPQATAVELLQRVSSK